MLIGDSCQYWLDLENQKLSSPYHPQYFFSDGEDCQWLITAPEGNILSLEFDYFKVCKKTVYLHASLKYADQFLLVLFCPKMAVSFLQAL